MDRRSDDKPDRRTGTQQEFPIPVNEDSNPPEYVLEERREGVRRVDVTDDDNKVPVEAVTIVAEQLELMCPRVTITIEEDQDTNVSKATMSIESTIDGKTTGREYYFFPAAMTRAQLYDSMGFVAKQASQLLYSELVLHAIAKEVGDKQIALLTKDEEIQHGHA